MTEKAKPQDVIKPERRNIHQRISAVMADVAYVQKEDKKVNNQYTFVSHDAVTKAVRGALIEHGIIAVPNVTAWHQDGNRTSVDLLVEFFNVDDPKDSINVNVFGFGVDQQDKGPGKAFSYAKKYAFLQLFCLETGDDPERDSIDHEPKKEEVWNGPMLITALKARLRNLASDLKGVGSIDDFQMVMVEYDEEIEQTNHEPKLKPWCENMTRTINETKFRLEQEAELNPPE